MGKFNSEHASYVYTYVYMQCAICLLVHMQSTSIMRVVVYVDVYYLTPSYVIGSEIKMYAIRLGDYQSLKQIPGTLHFQVSTVINTIMLALQPVTQIKSPGSRLNIKMSSYQYRDPHVEDKTVSWPSYL